MRRFLLAGAALLLAATAAPALAQTAGQTSVQQVPMGDSGFNQVAPGQPLVRPSAPQPAVQADDSAPAAAPTRTTSAPAPTTRAGRVGRRVAGMQARGGQGDRAARRLARSEHRAGAQGAGGVGRRGAGLSAAPAAAPDSTGTDANIRAARRAARQAGHSARAYGPARPFGRRARF